MKQTSSSTLAALEVAYQQTLYEVLTDQQILSIQINIHSVGLDQLLQQHQQKTWALITAYNPHSQPLERAENKARNRALAADVEQLALISISAVGRDPSGQWPPEESLFVMGISQSEATALGKRYAQNAILYGELMTPPKLLWLLDDD